MKIYSTLKDVTKEAVKELYDAEVDSGLIQVEQTNPAFPEDLTLVVFPFLKYSRKAPEATAHELGEYLKSHLEYITGFNVVKGFLNLEIADSFWVAHLKQVYQDHAKLYRKSTSPGKYIVEYSSPNTNKPLHLGHIRNILIGHTVSGILKARGHEVVKANLINDRGIHICKSMLSWQKFGNGETPESSGIKGDHLVGRYYVQFDKVNNEEASRLIKEGASKEDAKNNTGLMQEAKEMLRKWEQEDPEIREIWKTMNSWTVNGHDETYGRLGVFFDKTYFESQTYLYGKDLVYEGLEKDIFYKKEDGSVWCNLEAEGLDEKLLLRADGTSVYMTQDLGTAQLKHADYQPDVSVYIVGNEQDYHFNVLKRILKKLGKSYADSIMHLSYGMVELPEGKMKTREGTVVDADDLMDEMANTSETYLRESGKLAEMEDVEIKKLAETIGLGALKYFILKTDIKKNISFNPQESIELQGHTGPFVQYTYARIRSILRRAEMNDNDPLHYDLNFDLQEIENEILQKVYHFEKALAEAEHDFNPGVIANYVFELAKLYNRFYHDLQILKEVNDDIKYFRLQLSVVVSVVIKKSMKILGIEVPERM